MVTKTTPVSQTEEELRKILDNLPSVFLRKDIPKYFGNTISIRHLANLDSSGKGPKRMRIGKRVAYTKEDFTEWIIVWSRQPTPTAPRKKPKN